VARPVAKGEVRAGNAGSGTHRDYFIFVVSQEVVAARIASTVSFGRRICRKRVIATRMFYAVADIG